MAEHHWFSISTERVCDVCGDGARRYHALVDLNRRPVAACPPCAARVASQVIGAPAADRTAARRAREVLAATAPERLPQA
ncbi:MAG TPA: hypothetical protein VLU43_11580 [Anaeromyxobacteraceae bacterium]|nr:hypothetical protein [Anaeromyxobacteraceae bacterium]